MKQAQPKQGLETGGLETGGLQTGNLSNPLEDLRDFAKESIKRHEEMQMATRRDATTTKDREIKRTFMEMAPPKGFTDPPQKRGTKAVAALADGSSLTSGAFYSKYVDGSGDTYLQGGQVKSGSGNFTIADLKVIDSGTGITEANGDRLVLEVTVDGYEVDGVLLAGLTATAAAYISPAVATVPDDTLPVVGSYTGKKVYIEIGRWTADDFIPANIGNIRIAFCPGAYSITRY